MQSLDLSPFFEICLYATIAVVIFIPIVLISRFYQRRAIARWTALAERLGLRYVPAGTWAMGYMEGTLEGRYVRLHTVLRGSRKNKKRYTVVQSRLNHPLPFALEIHREGLVAELAKLLGGQDIDTGDAAFDDAFLVRSDNPEGALRVLTSEVRQSLLTYSQRVGPVELRQDGMSWEIRGLCTDTERLEAVLRGQAYALTSLEQAYADALAPGGGMG